MSLEELKVERGCNSIDGNNYFFTKIENLDFIYLQTGKAGTHENRENNFSHAYAVRRWNSRQLVMFSIEGISIFDDELKNRRDVTLLRGSDSYRELNNLLERKRKIEGTYLVNGDDGESQRQWEGVSANIESAFENIIKENSIII